jgi:DNA-binding helix-hairpin-helix protein with protein kinase domain
MLPDARGKGIEKLRVELRNSQLQKYLECVFIKRANIDEVGPGRRATLASYGIETAWHVRQNAVRNVPGFGAKLTGRLLDWRRSMERGFRFDPSRGLDPADVASLDRALLDTQRRLAAELGKGPAELNQLRSHAINRAVALKRETAEALRELAQARANRKAASL